MNIKNDYINLLKNSGVWDPEGDYEKIYNKYRFRETGQDVGKEIKEFEADINERCNRIPLGHILGYVELNSNRYVVGTGVFIPRIQSLGIIDWIKENKRIDSSSLVYDLCSGSGAIGIEMWKMTNAKIICIEKSDVAAKYLKRNILRHNAKRVSVCKGDIKEYSDKMIQKSGEADIVISNPPYVPKKMKQPPEWGVHHPEESVYAEQGGLDIINASALFAKETLKKDGVVLIEHDENQGESVSEILAKNNFYKIQTIINENYSDETGLSIFTIGYRQ
ncbi:TPA: peptide chain release factor N(5)-glutamine methyltransferase [Bacillus thuringiensis]|uniref:N5-glutamine methyltransferase family protein n=1 Tax=Bacillus TaxID=1386 RepID=UPI00027A977A|nr:MULTISPECIES: HemK/PrmC family methyltransferase [Bacillus]EJS45864.1 HemK family methyltransferase [Bacillus cereus BAG1X1-2]EJV74759.1 HemK family methyltransferase [Bacillus cereus HuB1-1]MED3621184.1 peptide chain release factor N(5)-glutamine methyltransferase [Bacillus thuringiensis]PER40655.1 peptide chain release factor N(5)-glutamine methyltransferase [Bacillus thuringiensis]PEW81636.1 peptide chain release factor N(5)-glutamine methyltransferase [Bacillus thuringiensis]